MWEVGFVTGSGLISVSIWLQLGADVVQEREKSESWHRELGNWKHVGLKKAQNLFEIAWARDFSVLPKFPFYLLHTGHLIYMQVRSFRELLCENILNWAAAKVDSISKIFLYY